MNNKNKMLNLFFKKKVIKSEQNVSNDEIYVLLYAIDLFIEDGKIEEDEKKRLKKICKNIRKKMR